MFPSVPRVKYATPPLLQVMCEFRFPAILKIESAPPVEFQELVRREFPLLERARNPLIPGQIPPEVAQVMANSFGMGAVGGGWNFISENRSVTISLSNQSLSITTQNYRVWEIFREQVIRAVKGLIDIYKPVYFSRVGVRYVNVVEREKIGLGTAPWSALLRKEVLGEIALDAFEANAQEVRRVLRLRNVAGNGFVLLQHGFVTAQGSKEVGYMIDIDFSAEPKTEVDNAGAALDLLHEGVGRALRWFITDRLHDALGPTSIDNSDATE